MTEKKPTIASLQPVVLADNRRVTMEMVVDNLPQPFANVTLTMPDLFDRPPARPARPDPEAPSLYPNVELSILNSQREEVASLFIVEHKERFISLTLHLPALDPAEPYTARAEMTYLDQVIDMVEVPFSLHQVN